MAEDDSGALPLDGKPLSDAELKHLRYLMRLYDRSKFACKVFIVVVGWIAGVIAGLWALWQAVGRNIKWG